MAEKKKSPKWVKIGPRWVKSGSTPWVDGYYISKNQANVAFKVKGESILMEGLTIKEGDPVAKGTWTYGDFGEADPIIAEATGKKVYDWKMEAWGGMATFKGVLSEDGKKVTFINFIQQLDCYEWMSDEDLAAFQDSFDSVDAPTSHYKPQPDKLGKFLFITGPPGLGKSTTGLLLSRKAGYVYYEADCFYQNTNPYIPPDVKEPSMEAMKQKPLKGMSSERIDAIQGAGKDFMAMMEGKEFNLETMKTAYAEMCKDLAKERKRLGGDWAIAQAVPLRSLRDLIRAELGPDLLFVVLNMKKEDQKRRLKDRHGEAPSDGGIDFGALLENMYDFYEPAGEDEPNAIGVDVTADMTREDVVEEILRMIEEKEKTGQLPWNDGHYICEGTESMSVIVEGENIVMMADENAKGTWKNGDFGEADPAVVDATGKKFNNWYMDVYGGMIKQKGVLSDDGKKVTFINVLKELDTYQWVTEEEFEAIKKNSFDPADAPPSHYKLQPDNLGKFLFVSGAPGLGKSTTGLMLSKMAGYIYYEADCFGGGNNPYLPPDAKEPSLESMKQKPLKGISQERMDAVSGGTKDFLAMINGEEFSIEPIRKFYSALCKDLNKERKRMGGDWVVAQAVPFRSLRDDIRAELGPDLLFVVLNMKKEDQKMRIAARHGESEGSNVNSMLEKLYDIYEPAAEDEPNTIGVDVTSDMTREDVVDKILRMIEEKEKKRSTPWNDGHYLVKSSSSMSIEVEGETMFFESSTMKKGDDMSKGTWKFGHFGEADPIVAKATGNQFYNWEMIAYGGMFKQYGVLSDDGKTVTCISMLKDLDTYQWVNEEEFASYLESFDPADAPPSHYTPQPEYLGKFLFISGAPGMGKSTTGLLLSRKAGYVYYEADCFGAGTNPYLPLDSKEPSIDAMKQKPLKGIPKERVDATAIGLTDFMAMFEGKEYKMENIEIFYSAMCKDLEKERKRLGGDWVVAQAVPFRSLRDLMRAKLGPDLIFVVLNMKREEQKRRITARHGDGESSVGFDINEWLENSYDLYEPAGEDEPNTINLEVTADMTRDDVVEKIMKMI